MPHSKFRKYIIDTTILLCAVALAQVGFEITNAARNTKLYKTQAYTSNEILRAEFEKEKKKRGLENLDIDLEIVDEVNDVNEPELIGRCVYTYGGDYIIRIGENYKTRGVLRHELFHAHRIYTGHIKSARIRFNPLDTYEDWIATSYGLKKD